MAYRTHEKVTDTPINNLIISVQYPSTIADLQTLVRNDQKNNYNIPVDIQKRILALDPNAAKTPEIIELFTKYLYLREPAIRAANPKETYGNKPIEVVMNENSFYTAQVLRINKELPLMNPLDYNFNQLTADFNKRIESEMRSLGGQSLVDEWQRELAILDNLMKQWGSGKGPSKDAFGKTIEHVLNARVLDNVTKRARAAETMELARQQREQLATIALYSSLV